MPYTKVMQNLFSFFNALFSNLLCLLIQLVLIMDKAICTVYDFLSVKNLSRLLQSLRRNRLACALAAFVPVFFVPGALLTKSGTLVYADSHPIGLVERIDILNNAVIDIEQSASAVSGEEYTLPFEIRTAASGGTEAQFLDEAELKEAFVRLSGELETVAVISINGEKAGLCDTEEEARTLLDRVMKEHTAPMDNGSSFTQKVRVDNAFAETRLVPDPEDLYETLSDKLNVAATRAVTYTETIPYETITRENDELDQDLRQTVQEGHEGEAVVTAEIHTLDGHENSRTILERTVLCDATAEIIEVGTKETGTGTGNLMLPVEDYVLTSGFKWRWGRLHGGVDLAVEEGTPVSAADNGKVIVAETGYGGGYGNYVILDHQNGLKTLYGHNSELLVSVGDIVKKGETIALSGNTGNSTGPHLHFEIRENDEQVDPQQYVTIA